MESGRKIYDLREEGIRKGCVYREGR